MDIPIVLLDITTSFATTFGDPWPLVALLAGIPLAFLIAGRVMRLARRA